MWRYNINILAGPIYADPNEGVVAVLDNRAKEMQARGVVPVSHNVLSKKDVEKLYLSPSLSIDSPRTFLTRIILHVSLLTACRPTSLATMKISQWREARNNDEDVLVYTSVMGCRDGSTKTEKGGIRAIGQSPTTFYLWKSTALGGKLCVYDDILDYIKIRNSLQPATDRFFLQPNDRATLSSRRTFFTRQHVGKNSFMNFIKIACDAEGVCGEGMKDLITNHSTRGTVVSSLCRTSHANSSIKMRSGHRTDETLKRYQNLLGAEGRRQQRDIFNEDPVVGEDKLVAVDKLEVRPGTDAGLINDTTKRKVPDDHHDDDGNTVPCSGTSKRQRPDDFSTKDPDVDQGSNMDSTDSVGGMEKNGRNGHSLSALLSSIGAINDSTITINVNINNQRD